MDKPFIYYTLKAVLWGLIILNPNIIIKDTRFQNPCAIFNTLKKLFLLSDSTSLINDQKINPKQSFQYQLQR